MVQEDGDPLTKEKGKKNSPELSETNNTIEATTTPETTRVSTTMTDNKAAASSDGAATITDKGDKETVAASSTSPPTPSPAVTATEDKNIADPKSETNKESESNESTKPDASAAVPPTASSEAAVDTTLAGGDNQRGGGAGRHGRRYGPPRAGGGGRGAGATPQAAPVPSDEDRSRRVYVGNLAWSVSWQDLKDHFKSTGHEVTRADIMMAGNGRSKGCGIVEFSSAEGASQALLTLNDTELHGRQIFVREDREERGSGGGTGGGFSSYHQPHHPHHSGGGASGGAPSHRFSGGEKAQGRRVYVGNLSWDVAWQDLKDHMRQAGEVLHAEIITEANGRSKGCGIVEYATEEEAEEATRTLTDTELKGRMIFVREDREMGSGAGNAGGAFYPGASAGRHNAKTSVYVWNLDYRTSWQDLKDHARKAGNVDQAIILKDSEGNSTPFMLSIAASASFLL